MDPKNRFLYFLGHYLRRWWVQRFCQPAVPQLIGSNWSGFSPQTFTQYGIVPLVQSGSSHFVNFLFLLIGFEVTEFLVEIAHFFSHFGD